MQCAESLRVQAYFDGELDALDAAVIERHSEACAECRALLADLDHVRGALRQDLSYGCAPPPALRTRILRTLDRESPRLGGMRLTSRRPRPFWMGAFSGIGGTAGAAGLAFFVMWGPLRHPL